MIKIKPLRLETLEFGLQQLKNRITLMKMCNINGDDMAKVLQEYNKAKKEVELERHKSSIKTQTTN